MSMHRSDYAEEPYFKGVTKGVRTPTVTWTPNYVRDGSERRWAWCGSTTRWASNLMKLYRCRSCWPSYRGFSMRATRVKITGA